MVINMKNTRKETDDYRKLRQGVIVISILTLFIITIIKIMQVNQVYTYYARSEFYNIMLFVPIFMQIIAAIMFPISYKKLINNGQHQRKGKDLFIPEISILLVLFVLVIIMLI